jgi:uncharacterized protein (DUF433 family)
MSKEYVEERNGGYYVVGSRVSLDSIVYSFWNGESAETIAQSFPVLGLEQVYGAITYYLSHRKEIDEYIKLGEQEYEKLRQAAREADPMFYQRWSTIKQQMQIPTRGMD